MTTQEKHILIATQNEYTLIAYSTAQFAHKGQYRNDGKTPYITHPLAVKKFAVNIANTYRSRIEAEFPGFTFDDIINFITQIAYLHDVVEDTDITIQYLREIGFHPLVISGIEAITKHPVKGAESYLSYLNRVMNHLLARIVKLADLSHNMSDLKPGNMLDKYVLAENYLRI